MLQIGISNDQNAEMRKSKRFRKYKTNRRENLT